MKAEILTIQLLNELSQVNHIEKHFIEKNFLLYSSIAEFLPLELLLPKKKLHHLQLQGKFFESELPFDSPNLKFNGSDFYFVTLIPKI